MTDNRPYNHYLIFALILIAGLGLALALPWLANAQGLAAQSEVTAQDNTPEATRYYVVETGNGTNPTGGWSTAFTNVQDALAVAVDPSEIWVAKGVYYPDEGGGQTNNDENSTFVMKNGVVLYGGFDISDSDITDRDWENNLTVLSGDIDGDDDTDGDGVVNDWTKIKSNNTYHVVTANGVNGTAVLDGFTITAGQANGSVPHNRGGGFYCDSSGSGNECSPSLINVAFSGNMADYYGGAMYNYAENGATSSPNLTYVSFSSNFAVDSGGAIYNRGNNGTSSPILTNVTFSSNLAEVGGAIYNVGNGGTSSPVLTNVTLSGNYAVSGGAMYNIGLDSGTSSPILTNVTLSGNSANVNGGAMYSHGYGGNCSPILTNVTLSGNLSGYNGGAMFNLESNLGTSIPIVRNSILWNNQDSSGAGTITATIYNNSANIILMHSLAQGTGGSSSWIGGSYVDGGGNIDEDPMFVTPIDPSTAPTTAGNLRLQTGSPAIDEGDNIFAAGVLTDLDGEPRIIDGNLDGTPTVDMGAYETPIDYPYDNYLPLIFR